MTQLYVTPLPDTQASTSDEGVRAQIQQAGLLQAGGTATEKIAAENIDLVINGQFDYGARFADKLADEINSLGESEYAGLPLFKPSVGGGGRNSGYYEVERVAVNPVHPVTGDAYEYEVAFTFTGTRETHWSAVETKIDDDVETGLANEGNPSPVGIPAAASKVRWYSEASGKEDATASSTVSGEFGSVDRYDPSDASFYNPGDENPVNPILLYELDYSDTGSVDVRVYDDRDLSKYYTVGGQDFSQWTHAYHTSYEYEGTPIVDNGRHRLRYDEPNGVVELYEWNTGTSAWDQVSVSHTDFSLVDAEFTKISPTDARTYCEFVDDSTGTLYNVILSHQRGLDRPLARGPEGASWTSAFETYLGQFCSTNTTDTKPTRVLKARGGVK